MRVVVPEPLHTSGRHALERFTVSRKRRSALTLCFYAIPDGKPITLFLELLLGERMFLDREQFKPAAEMRLSRDKSSIRVTVTDPKICELGEAVYAWIPPDGQPVRIGTCGASAGKRLLSYPGYIN